MRKKYIYSTPISPLNIQGIKRPARPPSAVRRWGVFSLRESPGCADIYLCACPHIFYSNPREFCRETVDARPQKRARMNGQNHRQKQKRMVIKTHSRDDTERIPKCLSPESVNTVWIFLFYLWGKCILKYFPPEPRPGKRDIFSPLGSGSTAGGWRIQPYSEGFPLPRAEPRGSEPQGGKGLTTSECTPSPKLLGKNIQKNNQFFFPAAGPYWMSLKKVLNAR